MKIESLRTEYKLSELSKNTIDKNPVAQFRKWMIEAINSKVSEPTAMSVATYGTDSFPQSRIVLLKIFDETGFVFFSNYSSEKGKAIEKNQKVGLLFFWPELERQIRISGFAEKTSNSVSDEYFYTRPVTSQIGAIISPQSCEISNRKFLEDKFKAIQNELQKILRPVNWGGYLVRPVKFEFWQGRENRLHDRIIYEKNNEKWIIKRLAP
jgi:pyridoxamine 5'-phosphate oxidase